MRSEEEIRTVTRGLLREVINPPENTSVREQEWCGVALGCFLWVLEIADSSDVKDLSPDKFGGR